MDVVDLLIFGLRVLLVALLYLFLFAVLRLAISGLRSTGSGAEQSPAQRLRLQVIEPGESALSSGQIIEVSDGTTLGRGDRADMVLGDAAISAEHAHVSRAGRKWTVTDLGSTNGTRVNEALVKGRTPLAEGDVLGLGTVRSGGTAAWKVICAILTRMVTRGAARMQDSDVDDSTFQLVIDQLEELVVTLIEELRERPGIVLAVVAGVIGAIIGSKLARRGKAPAPVRAAHGTARNAGDAASLLGIGMRLLQNPLLRAVLVAALERQLRSRFAR